MFFAPLCKFSCGTQIALKTTRMLFVLGDKNDFTLLRSYGATKDKHYSVCAWRETRTLERDHCLRLITRISLQDRISSPALIDISSQEEYQTTLFMQTDVSDAMLE